MVQWPKQRSWGWYATLIRTPWFCLKILRFKPYGILSVQRHEHRVEVWLFLKGWGFTELYTPQFELQELDINPTPWIIPKGWWHTFRAQYQPVYAIELQYGRKVTELDIERK